MKAARIQKWGPASVRRPSSDESIVGRARDQPLGRHQINKYAVRAPHRPNSFINVRRTEKHFRHRGGFVTSLPCPQFYRFVLSVGRIKSWKYCCCTARESLANCVVVLRYRTRSKGFLGLFLQSRVSITRRAKKLTYLAMGIEITAQVVSILTTTIFR